MTASLRLRLTAKCSSILRVLHDAIRHFPCHCRTVRSVGTSANLPCPVIDHTSAQDLEHAALAWRMAHADNRTVCTVTRRGGSKLADARAVQCIVRWQAQEGCSSSQFCDDKIECSSESCYLGSEKQISSRENSNHIEQFACSSLQKCCTACYVEIATCCIGLPRRLRHWRTEDCPGIPLRMHMLKLNLWKLHTHICTHAFTQTGGRGQDLKRGGHKMVVQRCACLSIHTHR